MTRWSANRLARYLPPFAFRLIQMNAAPSFASRGDFPDRAASAFGRRRPRNVEFSETAAAAFGRPTPTSTRHEFSDTAQRAFSKQMQQPERPSGFNDVALSAFGKSSSSGHTNGGFNEHAAAAFGKKRSQVKAQQDTASLQEETALRGTLWSSIAAALPESKTGRSWGNSALRGGKKTATATETPTKKPDFASELESANAFPTLASPAKPTAAKASAWGGGAAEKPNFADVIRKRVEEEERERAIEERKRREEERRRNEDESDRFGFHGVRMVQSGGGNYNEYDDDEHYSDDDYDNYVSDQVKNIGRRRNSDDYDSQPSENQDEEYDRNNNIYY